MFNVFNSVISFFKDVVNWVIALFSSCLNWFLEFLSSALEPILDPFVDSLPNLSAFWGQGSHISQYLGILNCWIAVDVASSLILAYFVFLVTLISIKLFIKLFIPFVG